MNIIRRRKYILEFDVWDPLRHQCDFEIDQVVKFLKTQMTHCGNLKISLLAEDRLNETTGSSL